MTGRTLFVEKAEGCINVKLCGCFLFSTKQTWHSSRLSHFPYGAQLRHVCEVITHHVVLCWVCIRVKVPLPGVTWECVFCSLSVWSHRLGFSLSDSCQHPCHCYSNCAGWCRRTGSGNNEITTLWQTSRSHFFSVSLQEIFPDGSLLCGGEQLPPSGGQREHTGHPHTR